MWLLLGLHIEQILVDEQILVELEGVVVVVVVVVATSVEDIENCVYNCEGVVVGWWKKD